MSSNEDLERACLAAAQETREAQAGRDQAEATIRAVRALLGIPEPMSTEEGARCIRSEYDRLLAGLRGEPAGVMVPSQAKVVAKIIRNDEEANEVIAVLRGSKCHADREAHHAECSTCQRTERAVTFVRRLAGLGAP